MITRNEEYPKLAKALEMSKLFFKREDLHPYGSHKGRSIPVMVDKYIHDGIKHFAVSSSGNAALAAAHHIERLNKDKQLNIVLDILVGQHITKKKLGKLEQFKDSFIKVTMHDRPLQTLFNIVKDPSIKALRQSNDDTALIGYKSLGEELLEIKDIKAVFIGTSSGTTAQALAEYFKSVNQSIEIHVVQTSSCHGIASDFVDDPLIDEVSIADAIVDQTAIRKDVLRKLIEDCGGSGWIVSNEQIEAAKEMTYKYTDVKISNNSALSVAGLMQAVYTGKAWDGSVVCMICGD